MRSQQLQPDDAWVGKRLDHFLAAQLTDLSRARIQDLLLEASITVNGQAARPSMRCKPDMLIEVVIPPPAPAVPQPEDIALDILFEDSDVIVINKPPGLVVHPAAGHPSGTLVNALLHHCNDLAGIGGEERPGIVHRLDRYTSGVMVAAKHDRAMNSLMEQFKNREVSKRYLALAWGAPSPPSDTIKTMIGRSTTNRKKMSADPRNGKSAVTHYVIKERFKDSSLIECRIETGRTHQIRVHLAHIRHPIVGDPEYGGSRSKRNPAGIPASYPAPTRQMLHAAELRFQHPDSRQPCAFTADLPADMDERLQFLRP